MPRFISSIVPPNAVERLLTPRLLRGRGYLVVPAVGVGTGRLGNILLYASRERGTDVNDQITNVMRAISTGFEIAGVTVILAGFALALWRAGARISSGRMTEAYEAVRATFGRSVLLGLEILVAADLIRTIAVEPTLANLAVLAALVAIRTFLSWSLEVEIDGRWPWQRGR